MQIWQQGPAEKTWAYLLLIANYSQFIVNQYQEVAQIWQQGPAEKTRAYLLLIANYSQFIVNQYQEVVQKPAHTSTLKKRQRKL